MSYTPTTWSSGDLITSAKLNKIEQGLASASDLDTTLAVSGKPADSKAVGDEVTELKNDLTTAENAIDAAQGEIETLKDTAYIINTAEGDIAAFSDGAAADAKSVVIHVEPVQSGSGDPSPDNIRPISGRTGATVTRTGKNLLPMPIQSGTYSPNTTIVVNPDKSFYFTKTSSSGWYTGNLGRFTLPAGTYVVIENESTPASDNQNSTLTIEDVDTQNTIVSTRYTKRIVFTLEKTTNVTARFSRANESDNVLIKLMLFAGNTATSDDYAPYNGTTYPVSWENEAGTVYGGTIDVVSGVLKDTYISIPLEEREWGLFSSGKFNNTFTGGIPDGWTRGGNDWGICTNYKLESWDSIDVGTATDYSIHGLIHNNSLILRVYDSRFTDVESFKTTLTGQLLVFKSTTETEYQLTPQQVQTLLGDNVVWSDVGSVSVDYRADPKLYIEQLTKPTEDDMTANTATQSGKFFMVGNRLFLSTTAIASGDTINPGTNCIELSLADALNNLN